MHLLETYALSTGSKINKPFIVKKYFPLPTNKYITIQNSSGMPSKSYSYFQEVINFIQPLLKENQIDIIQIGSEKDRALIGAFHLHGQTNINQTAYILSNSLLHIGNDSFAIHMASAFNIPLVGLYSISSPEIAGPYWKNDKQICLCPEGNWKPSFNPNEQPKTVDSIKIEKVVESIEKILFNTNTLKFKTKYIGNKFSWKILETLPQTIIPNSFFGKELVNIRFDYLENFQNLDATIENLKNRPCSIITDRSLEIEKLIPYLSQLKMLSYDITENIDIDFVNKLNNLNIKFNLIFKSEPTNQEDLNLRKLALIDIDKKIENITYSTEFLQKIGPKDIIRTNKLILHRNKFFCSKAGLVENKDIQYSGQNFIFEQKLEQISDLELLKEDIDFIFIYENID